MSDAPHVLYEVIDDVAVVTLNDGQRMNPLSEALQECFHGLAGHMINF